LNSTKKKYAKIMKNKTNLQETAGNGVYSKCAEFRFDRTMEGVTTDMENGF
jgi:hypothetical protein